jgi:hypothetical protein
MYSKNTKICSNLACGEIKKNLFSINHTNIWRNTKVTPNIGVMGSEDTHLHAVLLVSISQVKGLREKLRCVQLPASDCDAWRWS